MDFYNPTFFIIYSLMSFAQLTCYAIFFQGFLTPKYGKKSMYLTMLSILIMFYIIFLTCFEIFPIKAILYLTVFLFASFAFYNGTLLKRMIIGPLIFSITAFIDFLFQFVLIFILQYENLEIVPLYIYIVIFISETIIIYIINNFLLIYLNSAFFTSQKSYQLFLVLTLYLFFISIILSESFFINHIISFDNQFHNQKSYYIAASVCFLICLFIMKYMYELLKTLKQNTLQQLISQTIHKEYINQLNTYLEMKNNDDQAIRQMRHDIINYLQTIETYNQTNNKNK